MSIIFFTLDYENVVSLIKFIYDIMSYRNHRIMIMNSYHISIKFILDLFSLLGVTQEKIFVFFSIY